MSAPDLVVLLGDAAQDEGSAVLARLGANVATAVVPVALLADDARLDDRLRAFRFGAVAIVERTASADGMARRIAELVRELPERTAESAGELGEASIDEVVELFSRRLRTGILAVSAPGAGPDAAARIVLRGDRPVTQAIEELVDRLRPLVSKTEAEGAPLRIEFQETPTGKLRQLELDDDVSGADLGALFRDRRIVIVEKSPTRATELVQSLRDRGAHAVVIDGEGVGLPKARAIDPDVVVVDVDGVGGWAANVMRAIRRDPRLRWASLLVVRASEVWAEDAPEPDVDRLGAGMRPLIEPDEQIAARTKSATRPIEARLETIGPARLLRALARTGRTLHLTIRHARAVIEIDLAEGLVVGAQARSSEAGELAGTAALAALTALGSGRVRIEPREVPSVANVMSPVDDALAAADREAPPLRPSLPPPSLPPPAEPRAAGATPAAGIARGADPGELLRQLESLLDRIRASLPEAGASAPGGTALSGTAPLGALPSAASGPGSAGVASPSPSAPAPAAATMARGGAAKPRIPQRTLVGVSAPPPSAAAAGVPEEPSAASEAARARAAQPAMTKPGPGRLPARKTTLMGAAIPAPLAPPAPVATPAARRVAPELPTVHEETTARVDVESLPVTQSRAVDVVPPPRAPSEGLSQEHAEVRPPREERSEPSIEIATLEVPPRPGGTPATSHTKSAPAASASPIPVAAAPPASSARPAPVVSAAEDALPSPRPPQRRSIAWMLLPLAFVAVVGAGALGLWAWWRWQASETSVAAPEPPGLGVPPPLPPRPPVAEAPPPLGEPHAESATEVGTTAGAEPTTGTETATASRADTGAAAETEAEARVETATEPETASVAEATSSSDQDEDEDEDARAAAGGSSRSTEIADLIRRANYRRARGELQAAEADYLRVLRLSPQNPRAMAGLTRLHMARHDPRSATQWARRLVEARPTQPGNHVLLGDALQMAGDREGARREYERALALSPGDREVRRRLQR